MSEPPIPDLDPAALAGPALALFRPDRPHNLGAALRLGACLAVPVHVVEPCGFPLSDRRIREAGLDYLERVSWRRHADYASFDAMRKARGSRLILLTTRAELGHCNADYRPGDTLLVGQEGSGAPDWLHAAADLRVRVPMRAGIRSLNLVIAAAIVLGEALRQTGGFATSPGSSPEEAGREAAVAPGAGGGDRDR
jgi:tRNA (cytidine/uridine-2'-O-)-methyltransferase